MLLLSEHSVVNWQNWSLAVPSQFIFRQLILLLNLLFEKNYFFNLNSLTATTYHKWPTPISNHVVNNCFFSQLNTVIQNLSLISV